MRTNNNSQIIIDETDVIARWLNNETVESAIFDQPEVIEQYNVWCESQDASKCIEIIEENTDSNYIEKCTQNWNMPDEYKSLDIEEYLLNKCSAEIETDRVEIELQEFKRREMYDVLRFLKYLVDMCRKNKIVLGVGRGSSVASYCLYLLGVHKIDSLKYKLDISEFLK